jgi:hypothetical protein
MSSRCSVKAWGVAGMWKSPGALPHTAPGVRPSPSAASLDPAGALKYSSAGLHADIAAPVDGRTPTRSDCVGAVRGSAQIAGVATNRA